MFRLFKKNDCNLIQNNIALVSVHIPKTAGTSFRSILKQVYGEQAVKRLDIDLQFETIRLEEQLFEQRKLDKKLKVVHGHFSPALLQKYFRIDPQIPFVTWLRDPVERVVSNYFYLEKRLKEELQEEQKGLNILSKMQRSLVEYANVELNRNRMSKFLKGKALHDFLFVGIQEYYSEDLRQLAGLLGWQGFQEPRHNVTGRQKREVTSEEMDAIARLNEKDLAIYEEALDLRRQRIRDR